MTYKLYEIIDNVRLNKFPKYDALFDRVGDTRQNLWTIKYRPVTYKKKLPPENSVIKLISWENEPIFTEIILLRLKDKSISMPLTIRNCVWS